MQNNQLKEINLRIGYKLSNFRKEKGIPLKELAALFGVSIQQIHKYEKGYNRIGAAYLAILCRTYGIDIRRFLTFPSTGFLKKY